MSLLKRNWTSERCRSDPRGGAGASPRQLLRPLLFEIKCIFVTPFRRALRQAWELDDAAKAEKLIRNLAQRLERDAPGVSKSILEGLDEILTVSRLGLPAELRRSLACTNIIENMMGTVRRVTRNVKRWSSSSMALRLTAAAMNEAKKGFRRLKGSRLPLTTKRTQTIALLSKLRRPLNVIHGNARFTKFNKARGNSHCEGGPCYVL
jgi:hypothetical protein